MSDAKAYLIGAGPGAPGLLTVRGAELLRRAEVVIFDGLVNADLLHLVPPTAEIIYGGKHDRTRCISQDKLNALLLNRARAGKRVVRLKGGDPYLFGRGGEEAEVLAASGIPFEVVPGVSSIHSVPCFAGIPLTHREYSSSFTVITGHEKPLSLRNKHDWEQLGKWRGTLVVLMGLRNLRLIAEMLVANGRAGTTPVCVISQGTSSSQRTVTGTLLNIANLVELENLQPPAVTVIGDVVNLRTQLNWFEQQPLFGKRIVLTQRSNLQRALAQALTEKGAEVFEIPASQCLSNADSALTDTTLARLNSYDWILFTNPVTIDLFLTRLLRTHGDLRALGPARLGTYGPMTAEKLQAWHLKPCAVPADHKTALILDAVLKSGSVTGLKFLIVSGEGATEKVPEGLRELGAQVDVLPIYTLEPEVRTGATELKRFNQQGADWIVFASRVAIEHFHKRFDLRAILKSFPQTRIAVASSAIKEALEKLGLAPSVIAEPGDVQGLVNKIIIKTEIETGELKASA